MVYRLTFPPLSAGIMIPHPRSFRKTRSGKVVGGRSVRDSGLYAAPHLPFLHVKHKQKRFKGEQGRSLTKGITLSAREEKSSRTHKVSAQRKCSLSLLVPPTGLEPVRSCLRQILSLLRVPISSQRQSAKSGRKLLSSANQPDCKTILRLLSYMIGMKLSSLTIHNPRATSFTVLRRSDKIGT